MGEKRIVKSADPLTSLNTIIRLIKVHTKEKKPKIINLTTTGNTIEQLSFIEKYTTKQHFEIKGELNYSNNYREDVIDLILGRHNRIDLALNYYWGSLNIAWQIRETQEEISIMRFPKPRFELSDKGRYISLIAPSLLHFIDSRVNLCEQQVLEDGTKIFINWLDFKRNIEDLQLVIRKGNIEKACLFMSLFLERISKPDKIHVSLNSSINFIKILHESGKLLKCNNCCKWHFGYGDIMHKGTNIDTAHISELARLLIEQPSRDRFISFIGFTWIWETKNDPSNANGFIWILKRSNLCDIEITWSNNPIPRVSLQKIISDAVCKAK